MKETPLVCFTCPDCANEKPFKRTCESDETSCFILKNGSKVTAGCAKSCMAGEKVQCCTNSYCNYPKNGDDSENENENRREDRNHRYEDREDENRHGDREKENRFEGKVVKL